MSVRPPLLFYCQHSVGLGHLTRSYALCAHLAEWFRVVLVCGGPLPDEIEPPPGVEIVALPPLGVGPGARFVSHDPGLSVERAWSVRGERLLRMLHTLRPAVVFVELFPFGRAKFARELVPLLELAREAGAMTACSLRDILVTGREDQAAHDERACRLANAHLDAVLVHSDPRFAQLDETFGPIDRLEIPVRYTGFVVGAPSRAVAREPRVVVSAGGGLVGEPLLRAAIQAQRIGTGLAMRTIAGPLMPEDAFGRLRAEAHDVAELELVRSVPDLRRRARRRVGGCQPGRLQHHARDRSRAGAGARRPLRHVGGGRAAAPRAPARAARRAARARARPARPGGARRRDRAAAGVRADAAGDRPRRRPRHVSRAVGADPR
jgi:predicted glycosyltransferase